MWLRFLAGGVLLMAGYGIHAALPSRAPPAPPSVPDSAAAERLERLSAQLEEQGGTLAEILNLLAVLYHDRSVGSPNEPIRVDTDPETKPNPEGLRAVFGGFLSEAYGKRPSKLRLLNECARSKDEFLVAFAFASTYDSSEFVDIYKMTIRRMMDARAAVAARRLGEYMTPGIQSELISDFDSIPHPKNWATAVALAEGGDSSYLEEWGAQALQAFQIEEEPTRRKKKELGRIVHAALLAENPEAEGIASAALASPHIDRAIKKEALHLLANIGTPSAIARLEEIGASDDDIAAYARITFSEFMLPPDDE